ncbi:RNA polymerase sigma factor [Trinickia soli]|uniref:RNA polymerase sigma factor n=1 Tax=Trinickia soli TaxID=380675 RepID=UPI00125C6FBA|nr:RNA polymerase subunit sigma-70 [Paraburkholderia sp. T12-10]
MSLAGQDSAARSIAEAVARGSYGRLVALLAMRTRDVAAAEDALAEAFAAALVAWPEHGCPANPEGWLMTVARRRAIDAARHRSIGDALFNELALLADEIGDSDDSRAGGLPDRRLALLFACTHPALDAAIRTPLMLQVVLGLETTTIASAFLVSPAAMSKRLARAKNKMRDAGVPFVVPERDELPGRLAAVLEAIYAVYSEGWSDPVGGEIVRQDLTGEALFLAHLLVELQPDEPEALGLLSLMLYAHARREARRDADGNYVPLSAQNPATWNAPMLDAAGALLRRASAYKTIGRFQLEAALQSAHVHRCRTRQPNWEEVVQLYDALLAIAQSPVVAVNRALALAERDGPRAALEALAPYADDRRLAGYQPYHAARADLFARAGAVPEALASYDLAIGLASDPAVRRFLQHRRAALRSAG